MTLEEVMSYRGKIVKVYCTDGRQYTGKIDCRVEDFDEDAEKDGFMLDGIDGKLYGDLPEDVERIEEVK